ncbi:hypothetical protein [Sphingopyxis sp.]|uniref:hypothetical protein n=1 Tax=Sphingopyxis sp. TaxID=1908224 RepID=UPI003D80E5E3
MADSFLSPGIDPPSPTLSARLRELAAFLAAPGAGRLTEEQRALALGIARRLVADAAVRIDPALDADAMWHNWLTEGLPGADRLAPLCFARAEEHRWREQSAQRAAVAPLVAGTDDVAEDPATVADTAMSAIDRAYLTLRIADRRRFDALGNPCLAPADLGGDVWRALLLDVAAWRLVAAARDPALAARLGEAVRAELARHADAAGIDRAAAAYHELLDAAGALPETAATAIARHDWPTLVGLAAAASHRSYGEMALALLTAEAAALPSLLAPLRIERSALAPLEASLAMLADRAVAAGGTAADDYAALLQARADALSSPGDGG